MTLDEPRSDRQLRGAQLHGFLCGVLRDSVELVHQPARLHDADPDVRGALAKLREEIDELEEALEHGEGGRDPDRVRDELGDILYSVVNVSRYIKVDPELALRGTISKFMNRFLFIERELSALGKTPSVSSLEEMDALWNEAKRRGIR